MAHPVKLIRSDALTALRGMPDGVIHCAVTSPPYWGQREYIAGEDPDCLGNEDNPKLYIDRLVAIFREVKRVLVKAGKGTRSGVLWINICDTIASHRSVERDYIQGSTVYGTEHKKTYQTTEFPPEWGIPEKSLVGIPFRLANALVADGWVWRAVVPWLKTQGNPISAHPAKPPPGFEWLMMFAPDTPNFYDEYAAMVHTEKWVGPRVRRDSDAWLESVKGLIEQESPVEPYLTPLGMRVGTAAGESVHRARFSESLVRPLIETSCPRAACSKCHAGWKRISESVAKEYKGQMVSVRNTLGWMPSCACGAPPKRAVVLDPFAGTATTCRAALRANRAAVGIELSETYLEEARALLEGVEPEETIPERYEGRVPKRGEDKDKGFTRYRTRDIVKREEAQGGVESPARPPVNPKSGDFPDQGPTAEEIAESARAAFRVAPITREDFLAALQG